MIPGEIQTAPGEIELNAGSQDLSSCRGGQHRRPSYPGRFALSLLRN